MKLFLAPHNDDEMLFGAYTIMREEPVVVVLTDSYIQPQRGDIGCSAPERRAESIAAAKLLNYPLFFGGIPDTMLTEDGLRIVLKNLSGFDIVYAPAIQGGNAQHDMVGRIAQEVFGDKVVQYTTYTKTELWTVGTIEIKPTLKEIALKNAALNLYQSQLNLASTAPHFAAVREKSEWIM